MDQSNISEFFENKSVLVTGMTGFIGRAVVIKLLRSCPGIIHIYVLIRANRGKSAHERLADILVTEPFALLEKQCPNVLQKVIAISGNLQTSDMDLSVEDRERLCKEIAVVIHSAASINLDDTIQKTCKINLEGVCNLVEQLAMKMDNLEAFVHVSTAFGNCNRTQICEKIYPMRLGPQEALELLAKLGSEEAAARAPELLEGLPNTYTFAKRLAEQAVESYSKTIPLCIVRPAIVLTAHNEPTPGWIHGWSAAAAMTTFILHGFQRFILAATEDTKIDIIPVDHVVNLIIAAAWNTGTARKRGREPFVIYNCCSGGNNPVTLRELFKVVLDAAWVTPLPKMVRYPSLSYAQTAFTFRLNDIVFHRLPSQLMDLKAKLFCQKPRMMKAYWRMFKISRVIGEFTALELDFVTENTEKLYRELNQADRLLFNFDIRSVQWEPYLYDYVAGIRKYLLHGSEQALKTDRQRFKRLFLLHWTFRGLVPIFVVSITIFVFLLVVAMS